MSSKNDNLDHSYSDRISELGDRLYKNAGNETILGEVHIAIRNMLLESGESDAQIRQELKKQFDEGKIRPESFELVQEMLDRISLQQTTKLDAPMPLDIPLAQGRESDRADSIDFPLGSATGPNDSVSVDIPLEQTNKFTPPPAIAPTDSADVPLDQTVRIASPFPQEPLPQNSSQQDSSPTDEVPFGHNEEDDQEFINTAVLDDQLHNARSADDQLQVGSVLRDRFLLQEKLSGGSMGVVFKALDRRLAEAEEANPFVAIKVLSSALSRNANALRALQQEAAKGRFLSHPNIVRFIDLDREDSLYFIVMEWLEGRSLAQILDESPGKKVEIGMALNVVSQIARALNYAHLRGVVHADVKPGNIIITPDGHAKLLDFGVARIRQKQIEGKSKFDPAVLGAASPAYSSMQVLTGEDPAPADDVFSLGCLLYRMIAGIRVFGPRNAADAAAEGMEPQRPQGLKDEQWRALKKSLSYSRVTRFPTPKAFMDALTSGAEVPEMSPVPTVAPEVNSKPDVRATTGARSMPDLTPKPVAQPAASIVTATRDPLPDDTYIDDELDGPRRSPWRLAVIGAILIASVAVVTETSLVNYVDELTESETFRTIIGTNTVGTDTQEPVQPANSDSATTQIIGDDTIVDAPADEESILPDVVETDTKVSDEFFIGEDVLVEDEAFVPDEFSTPVTEGELASEPERVVEIPVFDYSGFTEPTIRVSLVTSDTESAVSVLSIREGGSPAIVELARGGDFSEEFSVAISEVEFSGTGSPLEKGRYSIEYGGVVNFAIGQERAQLTIAVSSNGQRESDVQLTLQVRGFADSAPVLAKINVTLEDDDLRRFEASLAPNTVSFTSSQVTVRESDPAVQVDLIRYRADNRHLEVEYALTGITATEGEDYFTPGFTTVSFGPGVRTARILLPLGQDAKMESDETFAFELLTSTPRSQTEILTRLTVIIRDDD